jgi:general stress protein 26
MVKEEAMISSLSLINRCKVMTVSSIGEDGYPQMKAVLKMENEGLNTIWISTNTSSKRVAHFRKNPKSSVYFVDFEEYMGLMLVGDMEVLEDQEIKQRFWKNNFEMYYPLGVTDPDYCILKFTVKWGNYYYGLENVSFEV